MNILGIGLDATDIPRIADVLERYGDRFLRRVFTDDEIAYCTRRRNPAPHLAGRFAAKEAAMKALGTGHSQGVIWKDIEVVRRGGPPRLQGGPSRHRRRRTAALRQPVRRGSVRAWRCRAFTVVSSEALNMVPPTRITGSTTRNGRRGTRTPDFLRVRQAL